MNYLSRSESDDDDDYKESRSRRRKEYYRFSKSLFLDTHNFYSPEVFRGILKLLCASVHLSIPAITVPLDGFLYILAEVFDITKRCVEHKNHGPIKGQSHPWSLNVNILIISVRTVIHLCMERFLNNLAQMFGIISRCVTQNNLAPIAKVKVIFAV